MSEQLQNEIRSTRPAAPDALRERVRAVAAQEPAREPFRARFQWRQLVLLAPATLVLALVAAGVIGLTRDDVTGRDELASSGSSTIGALEAAPPESERLGAPTVAGDAATVAPVPGQLQRYEAELRLRVNDVEALSSATKRAQRIALESASTSFTRRRSSASYRWS